MCWFILCWGCIFPSIVIYNSVDLFCHHHCPVVKLYQKLRVQYIVSVSWAVHTVGLFHYTLHHYFQFLSFELDWDDAYMMQHISKDDNLTIKFNKKGLLFLSIFFFLCIPKIYYSLMADFKSTLISSKKMPVKKNVSPSVKVFIYCLRHVTRSYK